MLLSSSRGMTLRLFPLLLPLLLLAPGARANEGVCDGGDEGQCSSSSSSACDLQSYDFGKLSTEELKTIFAHLESPVLLRNALNYDGVSIEPHQSLNAFAEHYGEIDVIPRLSMELSVDGRIAPDDSKAPRPSVSVKEYLSHAAQGAEGLEKVLYGQMLTKEQIVKREKTLEKKKQIKKGRSDADIAYDVSKFERVLPEGLKSLKEAPETPLLYMSQSGGSHPFQCHGKSAQGLVFGETEWFFYPPSGVPDSVSSYFILSEVDGEYLRSLPEELRPQRCAPSPGDVLLVPLFWHYARVSRVDSAVAVRQALHVPVKPNSDDGLAERKALSKKFPEVHQLHVDLALSVVQKNPDMTIQRMNAAIESSPNNIALRWQVCRLLARIGARADALRLASQSIKLLAEASGAAVKTKEEKGEGEEVKEEEEEEDKVNYGQVSSSVAKIHWHKFGLLLLSDLNMPLEAIVCFQMRLRITPEDVQTIMLKARALTMMGALEEAKEALEDALNVDPDNEQARKMFDELDSEEAKNMAETMRSMRGEEENKFSMEALNAIKDQLL